MPTPIVRCLVVVLGAAIASAIAIAIAPSDASACGAWTLHERASGDTARFDVSSVLHGTRRRKGQKSILAVRGESDGDQYAVIRQGDVPIKIDGETVRRGKKKIGSIAGTTITIGKSTYTVDIAPLPPDGKRPVPVRWRVSVKRGDEIFAEGDAMALCRPGSDDEKAKLSAEQEAFERADVLRHVVYYLAWRGR